MRDIVKKELRSVIQTAAAAIVSALLLVGAPSVSVAQDGAAATKATVKEKHGDWDIVCTSDTACAMSQVFLDGDKRPVVAIRISKLKEPQDTDQGKVLAVARIITPLNVILPDGLGMRIDGGDIRTAPYFVCNSIGCMSRPPLQEEIIDQFKSGEKIEFLTAVETTEGRKVVVSPISLSGFTAAFDAL